MGSSISRQYDVIGAPLSAGGDHWRVREWTPALVRVGGRGVEGGPAPEQNSRGSLYGLNRETHIKQAIGE